MQLSCGTPAQRKSERPVFHPRDKSSGIRHCWHRTNQLFITMNKVTRVQGLHRHSDTMPAQGSSMLTAEKPDVAELRRRRWTPLRRDSGWDAYPSSQTQNPRQASNHGMTCKLA